MFKEVFMFNKKENKNKWFDIAIKLRKKGKLEEPYYSLLDYYINMTVDAPVKKYRDNSCLVHFIYFSNLKDNNQLEEFSKNMNEILPQDLKNNFNKALDKFNKITDYDAEENYDLFDEEDDFVDKKSEDIKNILENYIRLLEYKF